MIDAEIHEAVMALPPDERRDRTKVNEAVRDGLALGRLSAGRERGPVRRSESDGIVYRSPLNENACCDDSQQALWCVTAQTAGFEPDKWLIRGWSAGRSCGCA